MKKSILFLFLLLFIFLAGPAAAVQRVALVIGNGDYRESPLKNPVNDAEDIAAALQKLGFEVIKKLNADSRTMLDAMDRFYKELQQAEVGLFYYAGHGLQLDGENYLIPVGARVTNAGDVKYEAVAAGRLLGKMQDAGNKLNIVILDACRDNPFRSFVRSSNQGLAMMDAPDGTIVAYATSPGSVARDGSGRNGLYTSFLLQNLARPGLSVWQVFNATGLGVKKETQGKQIPWMTSSPMETYFLAGGEPGGGSPPQRVVAPEPTVRPQPVDSGRPADLVASTQAERTFTDPTTGMEFVVVPGGCFQMGDTFGDFEYNDENQTAHEVCVDGFLMGKYEVTQGEYQKITGSNPSSLKKGDRYPVENVSWKDAQAFIRQLNQQSGRTYRLSTEAEWEYAAREGGKKVRFGTGKDTIGPDEANFNPSSTNDRVNEPYSRTGQYRKQTVAVGSFAPNGLGLYDMSGNVWEWCQDLYDDYYYRHSPKQNPTGPKDSKYGPVIRGGSWDYYPRSTRAAFRHSFVPDYRDSDLGFRLVLSVQRP